MILPLQLGADDDGVLITEHAESRSHSYVGKGGTDGLEFRFVLQKSGLALNARWLGFWSWFEKNFLWVVEIRPDRILGGCAANEDARGEKEEDGFHLITVSGSC